MSLAAHSKVLGVSRGSYCLRLLARAAAQSERPLARSASAQWRMCPAARAGMHAVLFSQGGHPRWWWHRAPC